MAETAQQYTQRLLSYSQGQDPLTLQQAAPEKLATLLRGRSREELTRRPGPDRWSIAEITAHLADAEIAISWRLRQILSTNETPIQAYDQNSWASTFDYANRPVEQSLELFRVLRNSNLTILRSVRRELWENYGVHQERGKETVAHVVRMVAGHDLNHLQQIERIVKSS